MDKKIRWGILGCGKIANKFANDLKWVDGATLAAVASRDQSRAKTFAAQFDVKHIYQDYQSLASSPEIDVIYVATPHGFHYDHAMLCLKNKKAVLCEKPLSLNVKQVQALVSMSAKQNAFLMEAFWTKFLPQFSEVKKRVDAGQIGAIKLIQADFGFRAATPPPQRLFDPKLGGGSLLDIGIYPVFLAITLLGRPTEVHAMMTPFESGVDEQCVITMKFETGALAVLSSTFASDTPVEAMIAGTKGRIQMKNRFHNAIATLEISEEKDVIKTIDVHREEGYGYQFEARHVGECLVQGLIESPIMSHADSILLIETLDRIRLSGGIKYDVD